MFFFLINVFLGQFLCIFGEKTYLCTQISNKMALDQAIFRRGELLLGNEVMDRIAQKRVIIFGVGGVGS